MEDPPVTPYEEFQTKTSVTWRVKAIAVLSGIATIGFVSAHGTWQQPQHPHGVVSVVERVSCHIDVCLERGSPDSDCCANIDDGGCSDGYTAFAGPSCSQLSRALATCCVADGDMVASVEGTVAELRSHLHSQEEQMRDVQAQLRQFQNQLVANTSALSEQVSSLSASLNQSNWREDDVWDLNDRLTTNMRWLAAGVGVPCVTITSGNESGRSGTLNGINGSAGSAFRVHFLDGTAEWVSQSQLAPCEFACASYSCGDRQININLASTNKSQRNCCHEARYIYVSDPKSWDQAESDCISRGGHLTSVHNQAEEEHVSSLGSGIFWIGGIKTHNDDRGYSGTWGWSDGSIPDYENWEPPLGQLLGAPTQSRLFMKAGSGVWQFGHTLHYGYVCKIRT